MVFDDESIRIIARKVFKVFSDKPGKDNGGFPIVFNLRQWEIFKDEWAKLKMK